MPFQVGSIALHDDGQHLGSAKRDVVDGVAGLDPGGDLLAQGPDLHLVRDGAENIELIERTSGEIVARFTRVGVDDYVFRMHCGAVACIIQNDAMKDVSDGIAGLDGAGHLAEAVIPGIGGIYEISNDLLHSHDVEGQTDSMGYVVVKTITLSSLFPDPSTLRIKFDIRTFTGTGHSYGKIYKNGGPVGTERINTTTGFITYSEDLSFNDGDTLELWVKRLGTGDVVYRNFRIYGKETFYTLKTAIEAGACGVDDPFSAVNS